MEQKKRLMRSRTEKMIGGVCGGIAKYLDIDPTIARVAYVLLSVFTVFAGAIVYLILWMIMPEETI
ncbi:PspC domain-containing protein [Parabacteroides sp. PF5-6]|uniref:PspC domain-containing protein n=1 Tax=Parabacteroides sp. PF5-6 TaxID=1742403 RepID=UPI0024071477|nr:PspC domain-containing protein [Parabacteroides sp. PF5-6]